MDKVTTTKTLNGGDVPFGSKAIYVVRLSNRQTVYAYFTPIPGTVYVAKEGSFLLDRGAKAR